MIRPRWGSVVGQKTAGRFCLLMLALPGLWMGVYFIYPIYKTLQLSFYDWNGLTTQIPLWVGWENYRAILTDRVIPLALGNNLKVFFQGAIVQLILSFILGVLIVHARSRMGRVFLVISYVPHMIPLAVVGFLCRVVFAGDSRPRPVFDLPAARGAMGHRELDGTTLYGLPCDPSRTSLSSRARR